MKELINFKKSATIIWYDGPIMSIGEDKDNNVVLEVFCNEINEDYLYAYIFIHPNDVVDFLNSKVSFYKVIENSQKIITFTYSEKEPNFNPISKEDFLSLYGPAKDVSLDEYLDEAREVFGMRRKFK